MVTPPPFHGFARLCVFHVPRQSGHSGQCGTDAPKPGPEVEAHDVYHLDWESVKATPEQVRAYCEEWDDGDGDYYVVEVEAKVRVLDSKEKANG
jgi:hypothetical protein